MIKGLKDIKPIVEIPDNSLIVLGIISFIVLIALSLLYLLVKPKRRTRKKPTQRELDLQKLKNIDFSNDKDIAYTFTTLANEFLDDEVYNKIVSKLEVYKYKKDTPPMPKSLKEQIKKEIRGIKWYLSIP